MATPPLRLLLSLLAVAAAMHEFQEREAAAAKAAEQFGFSDTDAVNAEIARRVAQAKAESDARVAKFKAAEAREKAQAGSQAEGLSSGQSQARALAYVNADPGQTIRFRRCAAEFIGTFFFVFFGCGSAMSVAREPGWVLQVALSFGLTITVLGYAVGHYSGAQCNAAVSFGLMLSGTLGWGQGVLNIVAQMLGSIVGAVFLKFIYPPEQDLTGALGTNMVADGWHASGALVAEFIGTFFLMYVTFETAVNKDTRGAWDFAPIVIGLTVFLAHSVLIPIDGCSINPSRSFGPAFVQHIAKKKNDHEGLEPFKDMWLFFLGPIAGAAAAFGIYSAMN